MSAFNTVVSRLGELSESELQQLYSIVGIRLGKMPDGRAGQRGAGPSSNKTGKAKGVAPKASGSRKAASKGNPSRKSQWETHPRYKEYKRLKKVVETQAKERNLSFAAVDSPEREAYNMALSQWLEAKSSFRDHSKTGHEEGGQEPPGKGKGKANGLPATQTVAGPNISGKAGGSNWADEAQEAAEEAASSSEEEEDAEPDVPMSGTNPTSPPASHTRSGTKAPQPKAKGAKRK